MKNSFNQKRIVFTYFIYLTFNCIFLLYYHLDQFPLKYVYTDWLINYEGGFVRRGFLGQIIYQISLVTKINFKDILLLFQIIGYLLYFGLITRFLQKIKINFFWILLIFSTISFLYPFAELEATGRKDIYVILLFSIFVLISFRNLNECILFFLVIFTISSLIHEISFFYLPYFFIVIFCISKFKFKENLNFIHLFLIFIILFFLIYLNLIVGNKANINEIVISYNMINIDISSGSGALGWLGKPFSHHFSIIKDKISFISILRYGYILLINVAILLYFIRFKNNLNFLSFEVTSKKIFFGLIILSLPIYLVALDWGRVTYISFNFMLLLIVFFKKNDLIDDDFLEKRIDKIKLKLKFLIFILICVLFSPKILIDDDFSGLPLYKTVTKLSKLLELNLF